MSPSAEESALPRVNVLGVGVSAIDIPRAVAEIRSWIASGTQTYVTVTGAHGIIECQSDPELRNIHNRAGLVTPDGMPLVWLGRLAGHRRMRRVYGPDLMLNLCDPAAGPYRHFLYGGAPGIRRAPGRAPAKPLPGHPDRRNPFAAVPTAVGGGGREDRRDDRLVGCRHRLGRPQHAQAGTMDGRACGLPPRSCDDRRRCGVRLPRGHEAAGAALDAEIGARMGVPCMRPSRAASDGGTRPSFRNLSRSRRRSFSGCGDFPFPDRGHGPSHERNRAPSLRRLRALGSKGPPPAPARRSDQTPFTPRHS